MPENLIFIRVNTYPVEGALPQWIAKAAAQFNDQAGSSPSESAGTASPIDTNVITTIFRIGCSSTKAGEDLSADGTTCVDPTNLTKAIKKSLNDDCARINLQPKNAVMHPELAADIPDNSALYVDLLYISMYVESNNK